MFGIRLILSMYLDSENLNIGQIKGKIILVYY
jgi:hypothetical protein